MWEIQRWAVDSPHKEPVMRALMFSMKSVLKNPLNKKSNCWWFETPWHSCDVTAVKQTVFYSSQLLYSAHMGYRNSKLSWWRHQMEIFSRYWPFVREFHRSLVDSPHKGQCRGTLMFSLICVWTNFWANNRDAGDLRRHRAHYDVTVMLIFTGNPEIWCHVVITGCTGGCCYGNLRYNQI